MEGLEMDKRTGGEGGGLFHGIMSQNSDVGWRGVGSSY